MADEMTFDSDGVTLRDRFVIAWMTGMNTQFSMSRLEQNPEKAKRDRLKIAHEAYAFADAMLTERCMGQGSADKGCVVNPDLEKLADQIERRNGLK